ncbi:hypothetical protein PsorP6_001489 [Peronosclerospora sorghi]|uniref:Uncharacterized protein n=1 Tax=Peronosclerospora sorghi TaxID=230839 RepID=A0ACC0WUP6_9STRA|nr:hypothetical protein PsorP6_001489 [Peronosclerospora sorghi]
MKLASIVAAFVGLTVPTVDASLHLRVQILSELADVNQQCEWEDKAVRCNTGMYCQKMKEPTSGWCMKKNPGLNDQCGGMDPKNQPWSNTCSGKNLKCVPLSNTYSKCQTASYLEKIKMPTHLKDANEKVALNDRCKFANGHKECAAGLRCVHDTDWSGTCMKVEADLFDQCAGMDVRGLWKASCPKGALCREADEFFSQCWPEAVSEEMDA